MADREQIRREIRRLRSFDWTTKRLWMARDVVEAAEALLAELEQAERERDERTRAWDEAADEIILLNRRLARVPALVEALRVIGCGDLVDRHEADGERSTVRYKTLLTHGEVAREALAAWEQES